MADITIMRHSPYSMRLLSFEKQGKEGRNQFSYPVKKRDAYVLHPLLSAAIIPDSGHHLRCFSTTSHQVFEVQAN